MIKQDRYGDYNGKLTELEKFVKEANGYFDHDIIDVEKLSNLYLNLGVVNIILDVEDEYFDTVFVEYDFNKITKLELKYLLLDIFELKPDSIEENNFGILRLWWSE